MTWWQFMLLALMVPLSVEASIRLRWKEIRGMFDRALMHGGSLDTLTKALRAAAEESGTRSAQAVESVRLLKQRVDEIAARMKMLEEHPVLRKLGGNGGKG